jgi:hypothetical protein
VVNKKRSSGITATNGKTNNLLGFIPRAYKLYNTRVYPSIMYKDLGNTVELALNACFTLSGQFASFALVRGDDGDLPETSASVLRLTSPVLLGPLVRKVRRTAVLTPGTAHFELRQLDHLGTNGSILETDTPRQAAGCRFYRSVGS